MDNSTKVGIGVGCLGLLLVGVYAWYNDRCKQEVIGYKKGLSDGCKIGLDGISKYKGHVEKLQKEIEELGKFKLELQQKDARYQEQLLEIYTFLKENAHISPETYQTLVNDIKCGSTETFVRIVDEAKCELEREYEYEKSLYEKSKIKGCICNKRFTSAGCILEICRPWDMNLSEVDDFCWGEYEYRWPTHYEPIKREMNSISLRISSCWELLQEIKEVTAHRSITECIAEEIAKYQYLSSYFPKWFSVVRKIEKWEEPSGTGANELYHRICMEVIERCGPFLNDVVAFDSTNGGQIYSNWLDHAILQECQDVRSQIEAWIDNLPDKEKRMISERMLLIDKFRTHEQVQGILIFHDGVPTIRFCGGINVRLALPDTPLYYEGADFLVRTNRDLRKFMMALIPNWNDSPIADHRVYAAINGFRKRRNDRGQRNNVKLPAEGAVREFLKFKDAAAAFFKQKLRALDGKPVMCESVILKWNKASLLHRASRVKSAEITKMLGEALNTMQNDLNALAKSQGALLYCYDDLFPDFKSRGYYVKWDCNKGNSSF